MRGIIFFLTVVLGLIVTILELFSQAWALHGPIRLRDYQGRIITAQSRQPYSPRNTCGACHDYQKITQAYHFQQGRWDMLRKDYEENRFYQRFRPDRPWVLSRGMYGKW